MLRKGAEHQFCKKICRRSCRRQVLLYLEKSLKMPGLIFLTFFTTNNQKNNDKVHKRWNNDNGAEL